MAVTRWSLFFWRHGICPKCGHCAVIGSVNRAVELDSALARQQRAETRHNLPRLSAYLSERLFKHTEHMRVKRQSYDLKETLKGP